MREIVQGDPEGSISSLFTKDSETEDEVINVDEEVPEEIIQSVDVANITRRDVEVARKFVQANNDSLPALEIDQAQQFESDNVMTE